MDTAKSFLGATTAAALQERIVGKVLVIGSDSFTRGDLAGTECFNFQAAATLNEVLSRPTFKDIKDTKDVFERLAPRALAIKGVGPFALAVLGAAFEHMNIGGNEPLLAWRDHHAGAEGDDVTFLTIKLRKQRPKRAKKRARKVATL